MGVIDVFDHGKSVKSKLIECVVEISISPYAWWIPLLPWSESYHS